MNIGTIVVYSLMIYTSQVPVWGPGSIVIAKNVATQQACDDLGKKMVTTAYEGFNYTCVPTTIVVTIPAKKQ